MSRFNSKLQPLKTDTKNVIKSKPVKNLAGGHAYSTSDRYELVSLLLTSFAKSKFHENADNQLERLTEIANRMIANGDAEYLAKAALYARREFGMRSITHALASKIGSAVQADWKRKFFEVFPYRVDDITEVMAHYFQNYAVGKAGKYRAIPSAMKAGFAKAFDKFDAYQLAKYRGEGKLVTLVDAVNLLHPKPVDRNREAFEKLVAGTLKNTDTWEAKVSAAGNEAENADEFKDLKGNAFADLLREKRLGYLALVRNLRNILETAPEMVEEVCDLLTNESQIAKSLVFPFTYLDAFVELDKIPVNNKAFATIKQKVMDTLSKALEISARNIPEFPGNTLVVLDDSGSMTTGQNPTPAKAGGVFMAMIKSRNPNADTMVFGGTARYCTLKGKNILEMANSLEFRSGSTNAGTIFQTANKRYDRIIIISDMQSWANSYSVDTYLNRYKAEYGANPRIYSFDLGGHGTTLFPSENVFLLAGFSDKAITFLTSLERDKNLLLETIEKYKIS
mgnify:CR=1 FL=1